MNSMKEYLRQEKIKRLHQVKSDLFTDFGIEVPAGKGFTRSDMFHFVAIEDKKYVHKDSFRFVLTNGLTYFLHQELFDEFRVNQNLQERRVIDENVERMFRFFREEINEYKLFPEFLGETEHFFIFQYYQGDWENIKYLTPEDSKYIRKHHHKSYKGSKEAITPFFNQMLYKLVKNMKTGEIKMVDLKSLEFRPKSELAIYMYNGPVNDLYLLERRFVTRKKIIAPFVMDYPVAQARIIKHYAW